MTIQLNIDFWSRVAEGSGCWEWQGTKDRWGYGRLGTKRKFYGAHRVAWELSNGDIPEGLCVLHQYDNPGCCNPAHLFLGTNEDNRNDMFSKGRARCGHKITADDVIQIRKLCDSGSTQREAGERYGITASMVCYILRGKYWSRVGL